MVRIVCYKLCYILGVSEANLAIEFPVEDRVLRPTLEKMDVVVDYRTLAILHRELLDEYRELADLIAFRQFFSGEKVPKFRTIRHDVVGMRGGRSLLSYMNMVADEHNDLIKQVYDLLSISLPLHLFRELTALPLLTRVGLMQAYFLVHKTKRLYGLYFHEKEILNVSVGSMFSDDMALRDRLSLYTGDSLGKLEDLSEARENVSRYLNDVILLPSNIKQYSAFYLQGDPYSTKGVAISEFFSDTFKIPRYEIWAWTGSPAKGSLCLATEAKWVASVAEQYPDVDFAVLIPIESHYFKVWRRRKNPNIYFLDRQPELVGVVV